MNEQRYLLVVSGPSGIGKDTVVRSLIQGHPGIELSVSATTRPPRPGEKDGVMYHFISREEFMRRVEAGGFVEYTSYAGNLYGTPKSEVEGRIARGVTCVLVIEVNGAANVKKQYPDCTTVFIEAPSLDEHLRRLRGRGTETEEDMANRLEIAKREQAMAGGYDYRLVNDDAPLCAEALYAVLRRRQGEEVALPACRVTDQTSGG